MGLASTVGRASMAAFTRALPPMGDTERAALEAGTVGFEGELFAGRPDFDALRARGPNRLTDAEQAFLDNEVRDAVRDARRLRDRRGAATCRPRSGSSCASSASSA